jgi:hypothetical protein
VIAELPRPDDDFEQTLPSTLPSTVDELRVPLLDWTDPARPADGSAEGHIVRSID